jgi:Inhibitor of Apoptosis domain
MLGNDDEICCYSCDIKIRDLLPDMDPWVEHAKKNPNCLHLQLVKGPDFINSVQNKPVAEAVAANGNTEGFLNNIF